jgi:CRP/FNR family transcriptional regulator
MAEALLYLKEVYGLESDNTTINVVMRREDLANIAGTATETAIRILAELKDEGYVEYVGKKIKILRMKDLIHMANVSD